MKLFYILLLFFPFQNLYSQAKKYDKIKSYPIIDINIDSNRTYVCLKKIGIAKLVNNKVFELNSTKRSKYYKTAIDNKGQLWAASNKGFINNIENLSPQIYFSNTPGIYVTHLTFDKQGNAWIASSNKGLFIVGTEKKTDTLLLKLARSLDKEIYSIHIDSKQNKWVATSNGIVLFDRHNNISYILKGNVVTVINEYKGSIWAGGVNKLWRDISIYDDYEEVDNYSIYNIINRINDMVFDSKGNLWIASNSVIKYNQFTNDVVLYNKSNGYRGYYATSISVGTDSIVWIGTAGSGLFAIKNDAPYYKNNKKYIEIRQSKKIKKKKDISVSKVIYKPNKKIEKKKNNLINKKKFKIFFESASSNFLNETYARNQIDTLFQILKIKSNKIIEIHGYTDYFGARDLMLIISKKRAKKIEDILCNAGISKNRIKTKWFGKKKPIIIDSNPSNRKKNIRVEIFIK